MTALMAGAAFAQTEGREHLREKPSKSSSSGHDQRTP